MAARTGSTRSTSSAEPPTSAVSVAAWASAMLPDTGASTNRRRARHRRLRSRAPPRPAGTHVDQHGALAERKPRAPRPRRPRRRSPSASIRITTSAPCAAAAGESAHAHAGLCTPRGTCRRCGSRPRTAAPPCRRSAPSRCPSARGRGTRPSRVHVHDELAAGGSGGERHESPRHDLAEGSARRRRRANSVVSSISTAAARSSSQTCASVVLRSTSRMAAAKRSSAPGSACSPTSTTVPPRLAVPSPRRGSAARRTPPGRCRRPRR